MDGPSRGSKCSPPLPGDFHLPSKTNPLVDLETLRKWCLGLWHPLDWPAVKRREARYGLRGVRVGESKKPGPGLAWFVFCWCVVERLGSNGCLYKSAYGAGSVCGSCAVPGSRGVRLFVGAPRPRRTRFDDRPLVETVVDQAFQLRLDHAKNLLCQFLNSDSSLPSWEDLSECNHKNANQALMHWVQHAFEVDLTYNQAVEGVLAFSHEHFWVSLKPTWRLLRSWRDREPVEVRHPIHLELLKACVVIALCWGWERFSMLLWLGYHALLRPGELTALTPDDFVFHDRLVSGGVWMTVCIVRICRPKTRRLGPRRQHTLVTEPWLVDWIKLIVTPLKQAHGHITLTSYSMSTLNRRFTQVLSALNIPPHTFTLAGLRAGGASWEYLNDCAVASLKFRGRWAVESSLEHYIQECVAFLDFERLTEIARFKITKHASLFSHLVPTYIFCKSLEAHPPSLPNVHSYQDKDTGTG